MKCEKCGFTTEDDSVKFCPACRVPLSDANPGEAILPEGMTIATPGRRWSARIFDLWLAYLLFGFVQGLVFPNLAIPPVLDILVSIPLALCLEALQYALFGGTFGKWSFAVKVLDAKGAKIGAAEYARRLPGIWAAGLAFGIPVVCLIPQIVQRSRLQKGKPASYDEKSGRIVVQYKQGFFQGLVCILFVLVLVALYFWNGLLEAAAN